MGKIGELAGLQLIANDILTIPGPDREVRRTWRERLFTIPWTPLKATRKEPTRIPDPNFYVDHINNRIIAHPSVIDRILKEGE